MKRHIIIIQMLFPRRGPCQRSPALFVCSCPSLKVHHFHILPLVLLSSAIPSCSVLSVHLSAVPNPRRQPVYSPSLHRLSPLLVCPFTWSLLLWFLLPIPLWPPKVKTSSLFIRISSSLSFYLKINSWSL